jgi:hypothetical protein
MTAPDSSSPNPSEPSAAERPRLVINGVPVRPEDLGRDLSASVLRRLSVEPERAERPRGLERMPGAGRASWALGIAFLGGALVLALVLWLFWR